MVSTGEHDFHLGFNSCSVSTFFLFFFFSSHFSFLCVRWQQKPMPSLGLSKSADYLEGEHSGYGGWNIGQVAWFTWAQTGVPFCDPVSFCIPARSWHQSQEDRCAITPANITATKEPPPTSWQSRCDLIFFPSLTPFFSPSSPQEREKQKGGERVHWATESCSTLTDWRPINIMQPFLSDISSQTLCLSWHHPILWGHQCGTWWLVSSSLSVFIIRGREEKDSIHI